MNPLADVAEGKAKASRKLWPLVALKSTEPRAEPRAELKEPRTCGLLYGLLNPGLAPHNRRPGEGLGGEEGVANLLGGVRGDLGAVPPFGDMADGMGV